MDVYCVKDRRATPNVEGTEKIVWTKNKRKMHQNLHANQNIGQLSRVDLSQFIQNVFLHDNHFLFACVS